MRKIAGVVAVTCLGFASPAFATNGMRMIGFGPVQDSMGGASVAAPLDATTVVTNPAGMTAIAPRVDLSGTAFSPTVKYSATGGASGQTMTSDRPVDMIPTLATVYRVADKLTLGFAALGTAGMGVDYKTDLYGSKTYTSYQNMRFAPAAAYKVTDQLSVGVSANVSYALMKYEVASGATSMNMQPRDTQGSLGIGATLGATYAITPAATVAVAYETRSSFQDFEWNIPAHTLYMPDGLGGYVAVPVPGGKEKLSFDQPDIATIGGSYRVIPAVLLAADVEWIRWSSTNGKDMPKFATDTNLTGASKWNMNWSDQIVVKVGAEYAATKSLKLRAGYNYGKTPLDKERAFENVAFPAIAEHHVTAGVGYDVGHVSIAAAVMYSPESTLTGSNMAQGIASYETKMSQLAFDLGATYRF